MTSRPTATARLLRAVAAFGTAGALALTTLSGPATAQTDAPAATESSAAAESKGKIKGSVKLEDGKKMSYAYIDVWRKGSEDETSTYNRWKYKYKKSLSFDGGGKWDYTIKNLPAGKYRLVAAAETKDYGYGPQSYKKGATVLSGDTIKVKAGKTTKDINFKLVKAKKEMTDVEVAITGDLVVGETLTASLSAAPSGAELLVTWQRADDYTIVGGDKKLTLTPDLAGATLEVYVSAYKLGWVPASAFTEVGPIGTAR